MNEFVCSYGGGTHPWNRSGGTVEPSTDDGMIEVVGLTTYQLVSNFFYSYCTLSNSSWACNRNTRNKFLVS